MSNEKNNSDDFSFKPFKDLMKFIDKKGIKLRQNRREPVDMDEEVSDEEMFVLAMSQVKEIKEFRMLEIGDKKPYKGFPKIDPNEEIIKNLFDIVQGKARINLRDTQEYAEWLNPKYAAIYRKDITKKLHEKRFSIQDFIDLHGMTVDEAEKAVDIFINDSLRKGLRCIKFIHGRGLRSPVGCSVLKEALIKWLTGRYHKYIIAFATAPQNDGGLGAMYALLRKRHK